MTEVTYTLATATLQEPAAPLVRQSALEHIARMLQTLRALVPGRSSDELARRSDALLTDIGMTRADATRGALWRHCE